MLDFTPSQKKTVAAGVTVSAVTLIAAFALLVGWLVMKFLAFAAPALTPVVLGIFLSMLFKPYYEWIVSKVRNPTLALFLMLASVLVPFGVLCWFGGSLVVDQAVHLVKSAPTVVARLSAWVNERFPTAQALVAQFGAQPDGMAMTFLADPARFSREVVSAFGSACGTDTAMRAGAGVLKYLVNLGTALVTLIFFVFFLMRPGMEGRDFVSELTFLKPETRGFVAKQIDSFTAILVNFFQRQVLICLIEGVLYGAGFALVGLPYGFILGFLLGTLNLVPLLGSALVLPMALPTAYFADGGGPLCLVGVLCVWAVGQFADGYWITPRIQGNKTGLGYAGVIFSFLFWGAVFHSMVGLLMAIPLSAFCVVLWRAVKERYIKGVI